MTHGALGHLRILETGTVTAYAGKLFADHGAQVTLAEPPSGSPLRNHPPFKDGIPGPDNSLHFHYMSAGKRSLCLDLETAEGRQAFRRAVMDADIVLDDRLQDWWRARDLSFETLIALNPRLIWCAVTPFGQWGPYAAYQGGDLVSMAMGGMAWLSGYQERPIVSGGEIALRSASLYAAVCSIVAAFGRSNAEGGRLIDVSVQEVVALGTETAPQFYDLQNVVRRRNGEAQKQAGIGVYPCKDGYVMLYAAEAGVGTGWTRLIEWLVESGVEGAEPLLSDEWATNKFKQTTVAKEAFERIFGLFASTRAKQDLFVEGQKRRIAITPVNGPAEVLQDPHLLATDYFRELDIGASEPLPSPGSPFSLSITPGLVAGRAPRHGGCPQ